MVLVLSFLSGGMFKTNIVDGTTKTIIELRMENDSPPHLLFSPAGGRNAAQVFITIQK